MPSLETKNGDPYCLAAHSRIEPAQSHMKDISQSTNDKNHYNAFTFFSSASLLKCITSFNTLKVKNMCWVDNYLHSAQWNAKGMTMVTTGVVDDIPLRKLRGQELKILGSLFLPGMQMQCGKLSIYAAKRSKADLQFGEIISQQNHKGKCEV